jgi:hypothetical protein
MKVYIIENSVWVDDRFPQTYADAAFTTLEEAERCVADLKLDYATREEAHKKKSPIDWRDPEWYINRFLPQEFKIKELELMEIWHAPDHLELRGRSEDPTAEECDQDPDSD